MNKQEYLSLYFTEYGEELKTFCISFERITEDCISDIIYTKYCRGGFYTKIPRNAITCYKYIIDQTKPLCLYYRGYSYEDCQSSYKGSTKVYNKIFKQYWIKKNGFSEEYAEKFSKQVFYTGTHDELPVSRYQREYWIYRGYSEEETTKIISELQTNNSKLWSAQKDTIKYKQSRTTNILYWINKGFTEEEAKQKLIERQRTFTKDKCIEKYGEEDGLQRWIERQEKWQQSLKNKEDYNYKKSTIYHTFLSIHKDEETAIKYYNIFKFTRTLKKIEKSKTKKSSNIILASNEAIQFFSYWIIPLFKMCEISYKTSLSQANCDELHLMDNELKRGYFYDFSSDELNLIIEYNGVAFHPKNLFDEWENPFKSISREEQYKHDLRKKEIAISYGYTNYFSIWSDYTEEELNELLTRLYEIIKNKDRRLI